MTNAAQDVVSGSRDRPADILTALLGAGQAQAALAALSNAGWVWVPRRPTERMIEAAYWSALAENAAGVWEEMVADSLSQQREFE